MIISTNDTSKIICFPSEFRVVSKDGLKHAEKLNYMQLVHILLSIPVATPQPHSPSPPQLSVGNWGNVQDDMDFGLGRYFWGDKETNQIGTSCLAY